MRVNFDTLYSVAWLDIRSEPVIVSAPDTEDRYFMLPMLDMWTDVFATPGARTSGNDAHDFAVCLWTGPGSCPPGSSGLRRRRRWSGSSAVARLRRIGIEVGESFNADVLDPASRQALSTVPGDPVTVLHSRLPGIASIVNGWQSNLDTVGVYGDFYVKRALVAMIGLGANQPEDAVYPLLLADADGNPLDGGSSHVMHFDADSLPPVDAFWSVTMYDAQGFQAANPISRFAIGDRDPPAVQPRRIARSAHPGRQPGRRQGGQLAARPGRTAGSDDAAVLPEASGPGRVLGSAAGTAHLLAGKR